MRGYIATEFTTTYGSRGVNVSNRMMNYPRVQLLRRLSVTPTAKARNSVKQEKTVENEDSTKEKLSDSEIISQLKALCSIKISELENMKRLRDEDVLKAKNYAISAFAKDLLIVVDTLEYAIMSVKENELNSSEPESSLRVLFDGLKMTYEKLLKTLDSHGLECIKPSKGMMFDSSHHMAVYQATDPSKEPGTIMDTQKVGYKLNGRVLRAAEVGVVSEKQ